jgi:hypothetical protein
VQVSGTWPVGALSEQAAVLQVADSFGVPGFQVLLLAEYLESSGFSGAGIFKVKPNHISMLQDSFIPGSEADVDVSDPVINANLALGLISSFHDRGYSWEQSFLIYVWGWGELAPATRSAEARKFLDFISKEDSGGGIK